MDTTTAYLPGRMAGMNPNGSNKMPVYHIVPAVTENGDMGAVAMCGAKPKRRSYGWYPTGDPVTCEKCAKATTPNT